MDGPTSPHFTPVSLEAAFNVDRARLDRALEPVTDLFGSQPLQGIPFDLGLAGRPNVALLDETAVEIGLGGARATFLVFAHAVEDRAPALSGGLEDFAGNVPEGCDADGNAVGPVVSEYRLQYADGSETSALITRRIEIQQSRVSWGARAFAAVPHFKRPVVPTIGESFARDRRPLLPYGRGETRTTSADDIPGTVWLFALANPCSEKPIQRVVCTPREERSLLYGLSHTRLEDHPLRPGRREKMCLTLPDGVEPGPDGAVDGVDIDLGIIISARAMLEYSPERWSGPETDMQPERSGRRAVIEYAAHPRARLHVSTADGEPVVHELSRPAAGLARIAPAHRPVRLRVVDKESGSPVSVRLHLHGAFGEYLPPKGYHRKVNPGWFEDNYGEFVNSLNQYCYVRGECVADLPLGEVFVELTRGYECAPLRTRFEVTPDTDEMVFELDRVLRWRERGWVSADTHVHFLSPSTALLEGAAEGVNVVNLLASQWGEMFSNVSDFDGRTTFGAADFGGDGEFLVRVGTENRMQVLGHISLLGYAGTMIHPLCSGGPAESAIGDALEVTMADWARRCRDQGGLVVLPHAPNPQAERAADVVLGLVDAVEMMTANPFDAQLSPYGLVDWYRFLNLGYHVPVVGGSDKMAASALLGGIRTYAHLGGRPFTYENWMEAVRAGDTFVTVGPLVEMQVDGVRPGGRLELPAGGGRVEVGWTVESVGLPIERVEVVMGGVAVAERDHEGALRASGGETVPISESTWIAVRVRGSHRRRSGEVAAHSSAVQVLVGDRPMFSHQDAVSLLEQIEGTMTFVDTLAPRPDALRYKRLRATLEEAYNRHHQHMHRHGVFHRHPGSPEQGLDHQH